MMAYRAACVAAAVSAALLAGLSDAFLVPSTSIGLTVPKPARACACCDQHQQRRGSSAVMMSAEGETTRGGP